MSKRVNPHIRLITAVLTLAIWSTTTTAETIFVDPNAPGPIHNGNSWPKAYNYLQDALTDAVSGDQIRVAAGSYKPDTDAAHPEGTSSRSATFTLINGVEIYGGYPGFGEPDPNHRDARLYKTILTGDLNGDDGPDFANYADNTYHVVTGSNTGATTVLDGFIITSGNASGFTGGGMYNNPSGSPTINNCRFENNLAGNLGGGMYNRSNSNPTITDTQFINNSAAAKDGGGIYNHSSNPTFSNCMFSGNSAQRYGGAMCNVSNSNPDIVDCRFSSNFADDNGGATYNSASTPDVGNCTFTGNWTNGDGGGIYNHSSNPCFSNCLFSRNSAGDEGGGIYNYYAAPQFTNSTFSGNSAGAGGGMYNNGSNPELINSIFWGNIDDSSMTESAQINGGFPQVTYSCIQDDDPNDSYIPFDCPDCNNIDNDPMFVQAPSDGGDGWGDDPCTPGIDEGANDDFGDLHLLPGSPCIDTGDNTMVPADTHDLNDDGNTTERTPLDLDYGPRFIDDPTTPDTGRPDPPDYPNVVDMGAYEFAPQEGVAGDIDGDGDVDLADFAILSYQWLDGPGDPSADIAPPGGDGEVNSDDLLVVAANWLTGTEAEVPAGEILVNLSMDESWMYQNVGSSTNSEITTTASIIDDPASNSSYTYIWEFILPGDVTVEPSTKSGGGPADTSWNFAAPSVNQPDGLSDSGQAITVRVTVTGDDYANSGSAEAQFGIALLGDVNNDKVVNIADRSIINAFWRTGAAGNFTIRDCDINSDGPVNIADRSIANAVWRGQLGQNSVSQPCPLR